MDNNKTGFVVYQNVESAHLEKIIQEISVFRYFITEKLLVELLFTDPTKALSFTSTIYIATYSETDPPIYILLPQLLGTSHTPSPTDYIFSDSFIKDQMLLLTPTLTFSVNTQFKNPSEKFSKAVMGGTFDHIHPGHFLFLTMAASLTDFLAIGITSSTILSQKAGKEYIQSWKTRADAVRNFLNSVKSELVLDIFEIFDPISKSGYEDYEVLILTTEVEKAYEANCEARIKNGLKPLQKYVVDLALIEQGKISSTDNRRVLDLKSKGHYLEVKEKWVRLCEKLGVGEETCLKWWEIISMQYSRHCRYYHTLNHIHNLYKNSENLNESIELCIFFHDLIYIPMKTPEFVTNEELSAGYLKEFLAESGLNAFFGVVDMILATIKHQPLTGSQDELEFLDLDLSILCSEPAEYEEYSLNIRKEYFWYTDEVYKTGRKAVLEGFLQRDSLYFTAKFKSLEHQARSNITNEISTKLSNNPNL